MKTFLRMMLVAVVLAALFAVSRYVDAGTLREWKREAPFFPFFAALALLTLLGFPTTPFFLVAGAAYGVLPALAGTCVALAVHLLLAHRIAATGLRPILERWMHKTGFALPEDLPGNGLRFAVMVRFLPAMPWFLKNYILCLAGIPFPVFFSVSFLASLIYAVPLVLLGESAFEQDLGELVAWLVALALMLVLARYAAKRLPPGSRNPKP